MMMASKVMEVRYEYYDRQARGLRCSRLSSSIPQAWAPFSKKLAAVLSKLEMDQYLIVSAKDSNRFVQFANEDEAGTRVEVTSNHFLKGRDRLNRRQISWLQTNGWTPRPET